MFGKVLKKLIDYKHSKNWFSSLALRGALVMFFFSTLSFSQIRVTDGDYTRLIINSKTTENFRSDKDRQKGFTDAYVYKLNNPDTLVEVQFRTNLRFRLYDFEIVDTIKISRRIDVDSLPVRAFRDMVIDGYYYVLFQNEGMIKFTADSLPRNKIEYVFERVKSHGKSTYKALNNSPGTGVLNGVEIE